MAGHFATPRAQRQRELFALPVPANDNFRPKPRRFAVVRVSPIPRVAAPLRRAVARATVTRTGRLVGASLQFLAGQTPAGRAVKTAIRVGRLIHDYGPEVAREFDFDWKAAVLADLGALAPNGGPLLNPSPVMTNTGPATYIGPGWTYITGGPNAQALAGLAPNRWRAGQFPTSHMPGTSLSSTGWSNSIPTVPAGHQSLGHARGWTPTSWLNARVIEAWSRAAGLPAVTPTAPRPAPRPRFQPSPYPVYYPVPEMPLQPAVRPVPRPRWEDIGLSASPEGFRSPRPVPRARPGRRIAERKSAMSGAMRVVYAIYKLADDLGELREVMQAIYDELDGAPRTKNPVKVFRTLFIEGRISELTLGQIVKAVVVNEIEDRILGRLNAIGDPRKVGASVDSLGSVPQGFF